MTTPAVVAVEMGYGHLRAAWPLAEALGVDLLRADRPPVAGPVEERLWAATLRAYETLSRATQSPVAAGPFRSLLEAITEIPPLHPRRDLSAPTTPVRLLEGLVVDGGLGSGLAEHLDRTDAPLLTTFFITAVAADRLGRTPVWCLITDTDLHRIWVPVDPRASRIVYLTPSQRAGRRLQSYGVPPERIRHTGFPLPGALLGGRELPTLRRNLAARLVRLDPRGVFRARDGAAAAERLGPLPVDEAGRAPLVVFAVGGAGAQAEVPGTFLPLLRPALLGGRLRLALVAGTRSEVAAAFRGRLDAAGLGDAPAGAVEVLHEETLGAYFARMTDLLGRADVLWTKPSEMVFYAALGLPLLLATPVGSQEVWNRRWVIEHGAGLTAGDPARAARRLDEWLADGTLASAAWSAFLRLPKRGLYRIVDAVTGRER